MFGIAVVIGMSMVDSLVISRYLVHELSLGSDKLINFGQVKIMAFRVDYRRFNKMVCTSSTRPYSISPLDMWTEVTYIAYLYMGVLLFSYRDT